MSAEQETPASDAREERLDLAIALPSPPENRPIAHERERNSTFVTILFLVFISLALASVPVTMILLPLWIIVPLIETLQGDRLTVLIELIQTIIAVLGNLVAGLLTALGLGIGLFFRRHSGGRP